MKRRFFSMILCLSMLFGTVQTGVWVDAANYSIAKDAVITDISAVVEKTYDGKTDLPDNASVSFIASNIDVALSEGTDFIITEGKYASSNVGDDIDVTLKIKLINTDYAFKDGNGTTFEKEFAVKGKINKAIAPVANAGEFTIVEDRGSITYTFEASSLLGTLDEGLEYGNVTYEIDYIDLGRHNPAEAKIDSASGRLSLTISDYSYAGYSDLGTILIKADAQNYEDNVYEHSPIILTINVKAAQKAVPDGLITVAELSKDTLVYGEKLNAITFTSSTIRDSQTQFDVPGTFGWTFPDTIPEVGDYEALWFFTPSDYRYTAARGYVTIKVVEAQAEYTEIPAAIGGLVYNGTAQALVTPGTVNGGRIMYSLDNTAWSYDIPTAAEADTYTVYCKIEGNDSYLDNNEETKVTVKIEKAKAVLKSFAIEMKTYDGTADATVTTVEFETDNALQLGTDYTAAAEFKDANAGENKSVTLTIAFKDTEKTKNYSLANNTLTLSGFRIIQAGSALTKAPTAKYDLAYNGAEQELVNSGTASGGTLKYKLANGDWQTEIPKAKNAGDYIVYYKVDGGINHIGISEASLYITINKAAVVIEDFTLQDKIYDGTADATVTAVEFETDNGFRLGTDYTAVAEFEDVNAGENKSATVTVTLANHIAENYTLSDNTMEKNDFSIAPLDISNMTVTTGSFEAMTYNGKPQTPKATADVTIAENGLVVTGSWSDVTNVTDMTVFTADKNFVGTISKETGMKKKSIADEDVIVTLGTSPIYNGNEQTQSVSVKFGEIDATFDISDNKATNVKTDGNYTLTVSGNGNFEGSKNLEWNILPASPVENAEKKTTARVRRGRTLAAAAVTNGELFGIDGTTVLDGTFAWVDDTKVMNTDGTEQMKFSPNDKNYCDIILDVAVNTYSSGGGSSSSSSPSSYTVTFDTDGGSKISDIKVSRNKVVSEPTAPLKDGFKFAGWFTDKNLKNKYDFSSKVTKNFTLYAAWIKVETEPDPDPEDKPTTPDAENRFDDVSKNDWYYDDVIKAVEKGLFGGTGSKTFAPNDIITRGMFVTVLYRAEGEPEVNKSIPFKDVSKDSYYANAVIWAAQNEIVNGISETEFAPNENITREQIAAIMFRYAKYKGYDVTQGGMRIREFDDFESISDYAAAAMTWTVNTGLMKGKTETSIKPHDGATRAEIAAILNRFIEAVK